MQDQTTVVEGSAPAGAELLYLDPRELVIGDNIRVDAQLDAEFIESIRVRGVNTAISAYRKNGKIVVQRGQRRTLVAVQTGRPLVPVIVTDQPQKVDEVIDQYHENKHRAAMHLAEEIGAFEQLSLMGMSDEQIAHQMAQPLPFVAQALKVSRSTLATKAIARWDFLGVDEGVVLAEFEGDDEAVKRLVQAAQRGQLAHVAQRLRDDRADAADKEQAAAKVAEAGVTVIEERQAGAMGLNMLLHDGEQLTPATHAGCPGHAAWMHKAWIELETADGEDSEGEVSHDKLPSASLADDDTDGLDEDAENGWEDEEDNASGYYGWTAFYVCTSPETHAHIHRYARSGAVASELTDEQREAKRAERRLVIDCNKAWDSAEKVRRAWLTSTLLARKNAPKGSVQFIAQSIAYNGHALTNAFTKGNELAVKLLGLTDQKPEGYGYRSSDGLLTHLAKASEARAQVVILAVYLAAFEGLTGKHSWRHVDRDTARYLQFLAANGYTLSDVEKRACGAGQEPEDDGTEGQDG